MPLMNQRGFGSDPFDENSLSSLFVKNWVEEAHTAPRTKEHAEYVRKLHDAGTINKEMAEMQGVAILDD